jgi:hypothetical protein
MGIVKWKRWHVQKMRMLGARSTIGPGANSLTHVRYSWLMDPKMSTQAMSRSWHSVGMKTPTRMVFRGVEAVMVDFPTRKKQYGVECRYGLRRKHPLTFL